MKQLLLINPSKRTKKVARKKKRSPAQLRNDRRLGAMAKKRGRKVKPRRTKISKVVRKRKSPRRSATKTVIRYRNPRKRKSNPRRRIARTNIVMQTVPAALTASLGALGLDVVMGYAAPFIPANLAAGPMGALVKAAGAIGLGLVVERVATKSLAKQVIVGGLTVTLHGVLKDLIATNAPQIPLAGMDFYSPAMTAGVGGYGQTGVGAMNPQMGGYAPAAMF